MGGTVNGHHASAQTIATVREAFVSALSTGLTIGAIVTLFGAGLTFMLIQSRPKPELHAAADPAPEPVSGEEAAHELTPA